MLSLTFPKVTLFLAALFPTFLLSTTPMVPAICAWQQKDSLIDEVFSFSIDMDGAQAMRRHEDVGEERGVAVGLQSLEHVDSPLEQPS